MSILYHIGIHFYYWIILLASHFNPKANLWVKGRKNWKKKLKRATSNTEHIIWFHAASLGEFEQGRPLIEKIKSENKSAFILLSFFSPSGYEVQKKYKLADYVCYLPADTKANAKAFIDIVNPQKVFFIKYEFWFNYMRELKHRNTPLFLVSGIFRKEQIFFKPYGVWFKKQLKAFHYFFVQNRDSVGHLNSIGYENVIQTGDTRFDRVIEIAELDREVEGISTFINQKPCVIIGSSWPKEEELLAAYINQRPDYKYIIAPHEVNEQHIEQLESKIKLNTQRWSEFDASASIKTHVLIIDRIGLLSKLYKYGSVAYVGGAFGKGLHNILEAAVFQLPVIFGPHYSKFQEASILIHEKGAFSISSSEELFLKLDLLLEDENLKNEMGQHAKDFIYKSKGASAQIYEHVFS